MNTRRMFYRQCLALHELLTFTNDDLGPPKADPRPLKYPSLHKWGSSGKRGGGATKWAWGLIGVPGSGFV